MKRLSIVCLAFGAAMMAMASGASAKVTIGAAMPVFDDNWQTLLRQAMADHAKSLDVDLQFQDAQTDVGRQINQVQNFISQKVDAIILCPVDTASTKRIQAAADQAGIPLVYVNRRPDAKALSAKTAVVVSDDLLAGRLEATEIAKRLNGKGNVVFLLGDLSNNATQGRTDGAKEVLAKYPEIKIIEEQTAIWDRTKAIDLVNNWLSKGDKIDAVIANNDEMALGAVIALRQAGKDPQTVPIGGVDATADGLAALGKGDLAVSIFQNAKAQGIHSIDNAIKLAKGEKVEQFDWIPYELVTKENMTKYLNQ
jgi:inositol transport system substrate-binding protein